jgi:DNA-3-methyladenine glycosylase II
MAQRRQEDLGFDHEEAMRHLRRVDRRFAPVIERAGPIAFRPETMGTPFASLSHAIVYQQLNGTAAGAIYNRVKALFGKRSFPSPKDIAGVQPRLLRMAGLSRAKVLAIKDLARKVLDGTVPSAAHLRRMSDEEIIEHLTQVRGIGRWTVEMLLIFQLGRPDVLPVGDYGVRQGYQILFRTRELPKPSELADIGERWRPYRTAASWYLWRALTQHRETKRNGE